MRHNHPFFRTALGGSLYCLLEILWRGYTHISMFFVGGFCFRLLSRIGRMPLPFWKRCLLGSGAVTATEFCSGLVLNRLLHLQVWDYSRLPMNLLGQICLPFTLLWIPISGAAMLLARLLDRIPLRAVPPARLPGEDR